MCGRTVNPCELGPIPRDGAKILYFLYSCFPNSSAHLVFTDPNGSDMVLALGVIEIKARHPVIEYATTVNPSGLSMKSKQIDPTE